jgi:hypothetical protein
MRTKSTASKVNVFATVASFESQDGVAQEVDVNKVNADGTQEAANAPVAEANSDGDAAVAADTVTTGETDMISDTIQDEIKKGEEIDRDMQKMDECKTALEKFERILTATTDRNETISSDTAAVIKAALESYDPAFFKRTVPALEGFSAQDGRMTVSLELLDNVKEKVGQVAAGAKEAFSKLIEILINLFHSVVGDAGALKERLGKLKGQFKNVQEGQDIPSAKVRRLITRGEFAGAVPTQNMLIAVRGAVAQWPKSLDYFISAVIGKMEKADGKDAESPEMLAVFQTIAKDSHTIVQQVFNKFLNVADDASPSSVVSEGGSVMRSDAMPGDKALFVGVNDKVAETTSERATGLEKIFRFELADDPDAEEVPESVKMPSSEELDALVGDLIDLCDGLVDAKATQGDLSKIKKNIDAAIQRGVPNSDVLASAARAGLVGTRQVTGYAVGTIKAYLGFLEHIAGKGVPAKA